LNVKAGGTQYKLRYLKGSKTLVHCAHQKLAN